MSKTNSPIGPVPDRKQPFSTQGVSGFIEWLVVQGIATQPMVDQAIEWKRTHDGQDKRLLFQILYEECGAKREQVLQAFAKYYSFKTFEFEELNLTSDKFQFIKRMLDTLPQHFKELATKHRILPLQVTDNDPQKLYVGTPEPTSAALHVVARAFPYPKYEVCYIALNTYDEIYRQMTLDQQGRPGDEGFGFMEDDSERALLELDEEILKGHLGEVIDNILGDAVRLNASDVHIIPKASRKSEIYFRIDGRLTLWRTIDDVRTDAISAVVKDIAKGTDRFERNMAQDGFAQRITDNKVTRFRLSIIPIWGRELKVKFESIVIRVLVDPEDSMTLENIGFQPYALARFKKAIEKPTGLIVLTGPTGSGKSTTLLVALRAVMNPSLNILTVEDPVEYLIDGARQVKLNPKLDFEGALRAILRHDPDIVMVGEMRDRITADMAVKLANTGHLTFSTVHTNDAVGVIARLYKMDIEPFLLAYAINIIVAQRLIRKLCERCKAVDKDILPISYEKVGFPKDEIEKTTFYRPVGCIHCVNGYKGRKAIHEVLYFTKEVRKLIMEAGNSINEEEIRKLAASQGMKTLREAGLDFVRDGTTTLEEIASVTADDNL